MYKSIKSIQLFSTNNITRLLKAPIEIQNNLLKELNHQLKLYKNGDSCYAEYLTELKELEYKYMQLFNNYSKGV